MNAIRSRLPFLRLACACLVFSLLPCTALMQFGPASALAEDKPSQAPAAPSSPSNSGSIDTAKLDQPGPYTVTTLEQDWTDTSRNRTLPVRIYLPDGAKGALPVIVFSHGLGGNRNSGEMWGKHWASHGYISVHLQHPGSDEGIWRGKIDIDKDLLNELHSAETGGGGKSDTAAEGSGGNVAGENQRGKLLRRLLEKRGGAAAGKDSTSTDNASANKSGETKEAGSRAQMGGKMKELIQIFTAAMTPANASLRAEDARFALDKLEELNKTAGTLFYQRVDLTRAGMCGHSFGGNTTLMISGAQLNPLASGTPQADPRYKAAIAFSAPPGRSFGDLTKAYGSIAIPMMLMTGTEDKSFITGQMNPADRRRPYDNMKAGTHKILVILDGGDHGIFNGKRLRAKDSGKDTELQRIIRASSLAFWNAHLQSDTSELSWLEKGGLASYVGKGTTVEVK